VDAASGLAVVVAEGGGIDAVDLRTGDLLWHSDEGDFPVAGDAGRIVATMPDEAAHDRLRIVVLDPQDDGAVLASTDSFVVPGGAHASPSLGCTHRICCLRGELRGAELTLDWETEGVGRTRGRTRFDLATGRVGEPEPPRDVLAELPEAVRQAVRNLLWGVDWALVDGDVLAVVREDGEGEPRVLVKRWDMARGALRSAVPLEVPEGPGTGGLLRPAHSFLAADARHVLLLWRSPGDMEGEYAIHETDTGRLACRLDPASLPRTPARFLVLGDRLVLHDNEGSPMHSPDLRRVVRVLAIDTGEEVWRHPVRSIRAVSYWEGPPPPPS
jgi:hypothetical protein